MIYGFSIGFGIISALDNPARQAFIPEMVGNSLVHSAVTLNSTFVNVGRAIGPVVAAVLISNVGIGWCFIMNAASFATVVLALVTMRVAQLNSVQPVARASGQFLEGLRYAAGIPQIALPIGMMALIGTFTFEFEVSLPLFAEISLEGSATTYSWLLGAFGFGAVLGGFYCMWNSETGIRRLVRAALLYAVSMMATSVAPNLYFAVPLLVVVGVASIVFITTGNSTIQLAAAPEYRGRVTALWSTAFIGSTPVGAAIIGLIGAESPRAALAVGATACLIAAGVGSYYVGKNNSNIQFQRLS